MPSRAAALLVFLTLLPGCGGSGGGSSPITVTLFAPAALSGNVSSLGTVAPSGAVLRVGDEDGSTPGSTLASFLSFDLASIPAGAHVTNAVLRIQKQNNVGDPEVGHGEIQTDDVDYGPTLDGADPVQVFATAVGPFDDSTTQQQFLSVTTGVVAALAAGRVRFQVRFRYAIPSDADGANDWTNLVSGDTGDPANGPLLLVTYEP
jgi:hypothetical protein